MECRRRPTKKITSRKRPPPEPLFPHLPAAARILDSRRKSSREPESRTGYSNCDFDPANDRFPGREVQHGKHSAFYYSQDDNYLYVLDQWPAKGEISFRGNPV